MYLSVPVWSHLYVMFVFQDMVAEMCTEYFQRFRRQTHVTPKSYLSFLGGYKAIYGKKKGEIGILAERMNTGRNSTGHNMPPRQQELLGFILI